MASCDYLSSLDLVVNAALVTAADRTEVVDFCYDIAAKCYLDFDMVAMAMTTVDRFLSRRSRIAQEVLRGRRKFRLVAAASLSLCHVDTQEKGACGNRCLDVLSSKMYTVGEIKNMESNIRQDLLGSAHAPTSLQIARRILSMSLRVNLEESRCGCVLDAVRFQTEHAVRDYYFSTQLPSTVAIAAVLNVFDQVTGQDRQIMRCALLRVLPVVISEHVFISFGDLLLLKERLRCDTEVDNLSDDATVVSETSTGSLDQS